jgi:Protein of unknown function (DUF3833)
MASFQNRLNLNQNQNQNQNHNQNVNVNVSDRFKHHSKQLILTTCTVLASVFGMVSCTSTSPLQQYAADKPVLDLKQYLSGNLTAHGIFTDRSGAVVRRFIVKMTGTWTGDQGVLDEQFTYLETNAKEKTSTRVWTLTQGKDGHFTGTAPDVVGQAKGQQVGNAFNWQYTLNLPVDGKTYEVQFDDWMYLVDSKVMLNKAKMSKWGISLGEVTLVFNKE